MNDLMKGGMIPIRINATGCVLLDYTYPDISFNSNVFRKYISLREGDGGLSPGKLVFTEEIENFAGRDIVSVINEITGSSLPVSTNIGGPGIVPIIHLSQLLNTDAEINFFGAIGKDKTGQEFLTLLERTGVQKGNIIKVEGKTPSTFVLVDPAYDSGHGERCFINNIGAAGNYKSESIPEQFYHADIIVFGGTALVPAIHDNLDLLLLKAKEKNCYTIVNTVYDFRNEKRFPGKPWPLARGENIDLLIMDLEEAFKISGSTSPEKACDFFISSGTGGFIITNGSYDILFYSRHDKKYGGKIHSLPVSEKVKASIQNGIFYGDTTGCGDNFCGGVLYSVATQFLNTRKHFPDLREAVIWGIASGGFTCSYRGGCYFEKKSNEKKSAIEDIIRDYRNQTGF